jgi:hypothetical protein
MLRGTGVALVSGALLLASCGDDDGGVSAADDQKTADEAIAAVERALRDDGFDAASPDDDDDDDDDLALQSEACRELEAVASPLCDPELLGETASATTNFDRGKFELSGGVEEHVGAAVAFVEQPQNLDRLFDVLNDKRLGPCLEEAMRIEFEEDADERQEAMEIRDIDVETHSTPLGWGIPTAATKCQQRS